jgi:hypothetical protein
MNLDECFRSPDATGLRTGLSGGRRRVRNLRDCVLVRSHKLQANSRGQVARALARKTQREEREQQHDYTKQDSVVNKDLECACL